jgi:four helix bundle protein
MKSYRELKVWQKGIELVKLVYSLTDNFPKKEMYGLANQLQRAAVSIPSNIAEGQARKGDKEFSRYLHIALGSLAELDTQVEIACQLEYIEDAAQINEIIIELRKMLNGLINRLSKE